ncbi:hypothetical protein KKJ01_14570 [Xenorhabdus bovienii]|uniref:Uncharacterized protein n=1 Tax=Xenorhabdus bovienii TaxID=40576 RepID=A0AAJ1N098_XENBV|nr:hypothetical protein [Xenorhabdus bovienii]MDE1479423.1 hypothetical protein [Xenorhabdus bovienii]MDE9511074.1 hypothetical protein [Xenorhabdus bovienii]MDE9522731.1 hypothetical protein [Xenorhabdus bovienii]
MRYERNPYGAQNEQWEQEEEAAAYQEMMAEEQGDKALELYNQLPQEAEAVLSPKMIEFFGKLLDENSDALERLNNLLYALSLLEVQRREAA